ncbi:SNF2 domain-containing protein ENL1 isoform X2 [Nymphaea colorata]|uniref:SNF2 domain-containing protein ENL1 isoform X2 n=1 Tax=Nymphaea colorata TaxID=210225 RepID=UPI00129D6801|nr:SNF2 domain-containing protein ENL1 isoform X2 [Nymphaea colorata]
MGDGEPRSLNQRNARLIRHLTSHVSDRPPSFSLVDDQDETYDQQPEVDTLRKVKVQGRRRLCKLSSKDDESQRSTLDETILDDEDGRHVRGTNDSSPSEIRDILKDLSSKLESLSIETKKGKGIDRGKDGSQFVDLSTPSPIAKRGKENEKVVDAVEEPEYESALSSLSSGSRVGDSFEELDDDGESHYDDTDSITFVGEQKTYTLPGKVAKMLFPHQREGLKWLWDIHCKLGGGILGDDMGLGKTMQISAFLAGLFASNIIKRALIVAPKTLLGHWIKELSVVGLSEKIREYFGNAGSLRDYELKSVLQDGGVLLTTYDIVRNNSKALCGNDFLDDDTSEETWDYIILDEGHTIKNPSTQRAKSLIQIPGTHRVIISGTPIQNNLKELWALFYFCCPKVLGDKNEFKEKYEKPILRGNDKSATAREKWVGSTVAKELREKIKPYFLRRLKSEVFLHEDTKSAKISKKEEIIVWLRLTSCQRQLYEAFLQSETVFSSVQGSPLAALTVLKKICDHPSLLTQRATDDVLEGMDKMLDGDDHALMEKMVMDVTRISSDDAPRQLGNVSCKINFLMSLLENLVAEDHNVLVFSQTRKMLDIIQDEIKCKGYGFSRIDGTTKASERQNIINEFQAGNAPPIFLLTSQVGGLGLTLTRADRVIVVDPAWNPSTDNQCVDRAYRIGQLKDVLVYRLMTCGTIEEKIYKMQVFKGGLFKTATEQKEQTRYFSQKDIRELFSLPEQGFDVSLTQKQLHEEHDCEHIIDDSFKDHVKFLHSQGIAGISHHSLLFSKTAALSVANEDWVAPRKKVTSVGRASSTSYLEHNVDGAHLAVNPREWKQKTMDPSTADYGRLHESEIRERIKRLSQILENKIRERTSKRRFWP